MSRQIRHTDHEDQPDHEEIMRLATPGPSQQRTQHLLELRRSNAARPHDITRGSRSNRRRLAILESTRGA